MALNPLYFVTSDLEEYLVDKDTGLPLAGGQIFFYRDSSRNTLKPVYTLSGAPPNYTYTALPNPITLSSVGTVQDAGGDNVVIYYYPWIVDAEGENVLDLYFIAVFNSNGVEQFTREAWPNITSMTNPESNSTNVSNQLANPQFSQVLINPGITTTYTVSAATNQEFNFAPDWNFYISGTGTVTVSQTFVSGSETIITNPTSYITVVTSAGITQCYLAQTFTTNSGLWSAVGDLQNFLSGIIVAENNGGSAAGLELLYNESSGLLAPIVILDVSVPSSVGWQLYSGTTSTVLPQSNNTQSGTAAYVQIIVSFPASSNLSVTSVQVVPTSNQAGSEIITYDQTTANQQLAFLGDYYFPRLNFKMAPSLLVGWDFPLNPLQLGASGTVPLTASTAYICDQTIAYALTNTVPWAVNSITNGIKFTTSGTNDAFAIMQYLTGDQASKILGTTLSVNVNAFKDNVSSAVTMQIHLFRGKSTDSFPTIPNNPLVTINDDGSINVGSLPGTWTEIARSGLGTAKTTLNPLVANSDLNGTTFDYGFNGWQITDSTQIGNTAKFAIVVTFAYISTSTAITVNSISLIPGDLPCRPAPQAPDEVLRECQYYYETNYPTGTAAGSVATEYLSFNQNEYLLTGNVHGVGSSFSFPYNTSKRAIPNITFYRPEDGSSGNISAAAFTNGVNRGNASVTFSSFYTGTAGFKTYSAFSNNASDMVSVSVGGSSSQPYSIIYFNYVADARLGVV